jgi:hypothetical protein
MDEKRPILVGIDPIHLLGLGSSHTMAMLKAIQRLQEAHVEFAKIAEQQKETIHNITEARLMDRYEMFDVSCKQLEQVFKEKVDYKEMVIRLQPIELIPKMVVEDKRPYYRRFNKKRW